MNFSINSQPNFGAQLVFLGWRAQNPQKASQRELCPIRPSSYFLLPNFDPALCNSTPISLVRTREKNTVRGHLGTARLPRGEASDSPCVFASKKGATANQTGGGVISGKGANPFPEGGRHRLRGRGAMTWGGELCYFREEQKKNTISPQRGGAIP